ncbi:MAG: TatD family hydrolase [Chloroflexi bacterium]|nr:TatD family hydrolase [Chloroflexota bacterium]
MLVDTHCHIQTQRFDADRGEVIERAAKAGVDMLVCVGFDETTNNAAQAIANAAQPGTTILTTAGIHPHDASDCTPALLTQIEAWAQTGQIAAIGECGLDFFRNLSPPERQRDVFVDQIELAKSVSLPLVVHDRDAHESVLELLRAHAGRQGVMHCFAGDWEFARSCLDLGFYISIAGPVTFQNAAAGLRETATNVPLDRLVVETDCPYLTPHPFRGQRNEPAMVRLVVEEIARLRGQDFAEIAAATSVNARALFGVRETLPS